MKRDWVGVRVTMKRPRFTMVTERFTMKRERFIAVWEYDEITEEHTHS